VLTCTPGERVTAVMARMTRHRVRHLPVVDGGRLAGIISIGDVVKYRLDELELEANVLRETLIVSH
jgi:CBS domain-containing protein